MLKMLFKLVFLSLSLAVSVPGNAANLTKAHTDALLQQLSAQSVQSFDDFLSQVSSIYPDLAAITRQ
jgi:hypothetical protein